MDIITRKMEPDEAAEVHKIAKRAFAGLEGVGIPKPKEAVVALKDGKPVGAVQLKYYRAGGKKIGYFDYAFVDPDYQNQGVGKVLYRAASDYLLEQGCDARTALVKDDNAGSFSLFKENGFVRVGLSDLAREFGLFGTLRLYLGTVYGVACGMDYYAALPGRERPFQKSGSAMQIAAYFLINLLLSVFLLITHQGSRGWYLTAYLSVLAGIMLAGYAGTLFSDRKWRFRLCNGGAAVSAFVNLTGGVFPMTGNWYPDDYCNSEGFRRDMGIQALTGWIFVLAVCLLSVFANGGHQLFRYMGQIGSIFLLYRVLFFYPFESFGGGRVYRWNRGVFFLMAAVSVIIIAYFF